MMILKRSILVFSLLLAACVHAPQQAASAPAAPTAETENPVAEDAALSLPSLELNRDMLYEFLLGDIAGQRGNQDLAVQIYLDLANETQDPRVARRAAQLAMEAHMAEQAVASLKLWMKLEPSSRHAKQLLTMMLLTGGRLEEAKPYLEGMLSSAPEQAGNTLMQIYSMLARHPDKQEAFGLMRDLAQPYPQVAEGHLVLAQAALAAGERARALEEVRKARALRPDWEGTVQLEAQLLKQDSPQQALAMLKQYLDAHAGADEVRLLYGRMLMEQKQYVSARAEFQRLLDAHPDNADLAFAVAMLSLEMGELDKAESGLQQALAKGKKDEGTVYYYLGQLSEAKKNEEEALNNYRQVKGGEHVFDANLRVVYLLYKTGKLDEARESLHRAMAGNNQQRVQLLLIEAQLLHESRQTAAAYDVLVQGLDKLPSHPDLLYQAAMLADQLGKHDVFERMMRKLIEIRPDSAQAYNALGYSLLDRNERVEEGMRLVEKASQLAPDDAAIMDSVGWGHYRMGNLEQGLKFLRRAYSANPDPEIAAHLGEVLWMQGVKDQAKKIWGDALKAHPGNPILQGTMKRLDP